MAGHYNICSICNMFYSHIVYKSLYRLYIYNCYYLSSTYIAKTYTTPNGFFILDFCLVENILLDSRLFLRFGRRGTSTVVHRRHLVEEFGESFLFFFCFYFILINNLIAMKTKIKTTPSPILSANQHS